MDKSAIQQIQQSAIQGQLVKHLESKETRVPLLVAPDNFEVKDLEQYMEYRSSYRFTFQTKSIKDFIQYGEDFDRVGALCFVDSSNMGARTVFDLGTLEEPLHQQHKAFLSLDKTAAFLALLDVNGNRMSQKQASDFIEDWADDIVIFNTSGDAMSPTQAANSLRDLTIETARSINTKIGDYSETMSAMEKVEAKNKDSLPGEIKFTCTPYLHLKKQVFKIRVSLITSGDRPALVFRIIKLESIQEEIAEEFKSMLVEGFDGLKVNVYIGS